MRSISPAQSRIFHCFGLLSQSLRHYSDEEPVSKEYQVRFSAQQHHQRYLPWCFDSVAVTGDFLPLLETESCSMAPASLEFVTLLPPLLKCLVARSFRGSGLCHRTDTISPHPFKEEDNLSASNTPSFIPSRNIQGWREEDILSHLPYGEKIFLRNLPRPLDLQCHL